MRNLNYCPTCEKEDCFGYEEGHCIALDDSRFKKGCPFFKTREQVAIEKEYCRKRVDELRIKEKNYAE